MLRDSILEFNPRRKITPKQIETWTRTMDKLMRLKEVQALEVEEVIDFVFRDDRCWTGWKTNILSATKLYEKWEKLTTALAGAGDRAPRRSVDASQTVHGLLQEMEGEL
jgi:hypothetical protein